jgi:hypothetical protein
MTIPTWNRTTAEFVGPFESGELDGTLELRRHTAAKAVAARFDTLLRQAIAAAPERAACRWHVVVLDIARL